MPNINNRKRRRRFDAAVRALYALSDLQREDGQHKEAADVERLADNLGEYVSDAYAGRKEL
jgi:hypothetical protein